MRRCGRRGGSCCRSSSFTSQFCWNQNKSFSAQSLLTGKRVCIFSRSCHFLANNKLPQPGWLAQQKLISYSSADKTESDIKVSASWFSLEAPGRTHFPAACVLSVSAWHSPAPLSSGTHESCLSVFPVSSPLGPCIKSPSPFSYKHTRHQIKGPL